MKISFYDLDLLSQIGISGGLIFIILMLLGVVTYFWFRIF